eukprot:TRINITY_DN1420_c0_g1_i1.p1 TRINITY_DN1420_c0_g1~~TRINITY_DN1420_c0_g1_i1.p1  ORF type:complete len:245 (+),score=48.52 TRINITY_DN1420_c0_g1_i1:160-894(+)
MRSAPDTTMRRPVQPQPIVLDLTQFTPETVPYTLLPLKKRFADPKPLGLCGFGLTTVLLNIHNARFYPIDAMVLSMGIFYGGLAQVIAGLMSYNRGDSYGTLAFCSYGLFWLSFVGLELLPETGAVPASPRRFVAWYLFSWGLFTWVLFIGSLKYFLAKQVVFASLATLFWLLALQRWGWNSTNDHVIGTIAGWEGIFCGLSAVYLGLAVTINKEWGYDVLPLGRNRPKPQPASRAPDAAPLDS